MKVGILIERLNGGGAERAAGMISQIISELKYQVFIIVLFDDVNYPYQGELINLGLYKSGSRSSFNKFSRYKILKQNLEKQQPDLVLDFRMKNFPLREYLINKFLIRYKMVNMVRSYKLAWYLPKPKWLSLKLYQNYTGIVTVAEEIKQKIENEYGFTNVDAIPNAINITQIQSKSTERINISNKYVIAVGRYNFIKQFSLLIENYNKSILPENNINLVLLGEGPEKDNLEKLIKKLELEKSVFLVPFQENPFAWMAKAEFLVLSSKNEGFPNVLTEALACETPVVSFNCSSGPSEIIEHKKNGLLVENQNFIALTEAMNLMVQDKELLQYCTKNALPSVRRFSLEAIAKEWRNYLSAISMG